MFLHSETSLKRHFCKDAVQLARKDPKYARQGFAEYAEVVPVPGGELHCSMAQVCGGPSAESQFKTRERM
eukprot:5306816-Amphidinium_carterae.2